MNRVIPEQDSQSNDNDTPISARSTEPLIDAKMRPPSSSNSVTHNNNFMVNEEQQETSSDIMMAPSSSHGNATSAGERPTSGASYASASQTPLHHDDNDTTQPPSLNQHIDMITPRGNQGGNSRPSSAVAVAQNAALLSPRSNSSPRSLVSETEQMHQPGDKMPKLPMQSTNAANSTTNSAQAQHHNDLMNQKSIEIQAQKYVPLKFAQDRIKKILADWTTMKMEYIQNLQRIETQYKEAEEEDQEYMKTFVKAYAKKYKSLKKRLRSKIKTKEQQVRQLNRQIRLLQGEDATKIDAEEEEELRQQQEAADSLSESASQGSGSATGAGSDSGLFPNHLFDRRTFATAEVQTLPVSFRTKKGANGADASSSSGNDGSEASKEIREANDVLNEEVGRLKTNLTEMAEYYESKIREKDVEMRELSGQIADLESFKQKIIELEEGSDNEQELDALITESASRERQRSSAAERQRLSSQQQNNKLLEELRATASRKESHYKREVDNLTETIASLRAQIVRLTEEKDDDEDDELASTGGHSARSATHEPEFPPPSAEGKETPAAADTEEKTNATTTTTSGEEVSPETGADGEKRNQLKPSDASAATPITPVPPNANKQKAIEALQSRLQLAKKKLKALANQKSVLLESIENYKKDVQLKEQQLKDQHEELEQQHKLVSELRQSLSTSEENAALKDDTISELEKKLNRISNQFRPQTTTGQDAKKELKKLKAFQLVKEQELATATKKLTSLQEKLDTSQQEYEKLEKKHKKMVQESEGTIQQMRDQQAQLVEKMKGAVEKKVERATAKKAKELEVLKKHHEAFKSKITKLVKELEKTRSARDSLQAEVDRLQEMTTNSSTMINELKQQIENDAHYKQDAADAQKKLKQFTKKYDEMATQLNSAEDKARKLYNKIEDMKGKIRVYARVRPFSSVEKDPEVHKNIMEYIDDSTLHVVPKNKNFRFNRVFTPTSSQDDVFSDTKDLIQSSLDGYNVCIFAYGQTGTGKTWTITGKPGKDEGLLPKAVREAYAVAEKKSKLYDVKLEVQMVELYLDDLVDLLAAEKGNFKSRVTPSGKSSKIEVKKDASGNVVITNSVIIDCATPDEMLKVYRAGEKHRHQRATGMNPDSSRSHLVFTVHIQAVNKKTKDSLVGKLTLVDLAGSESRKKTGLTDQTALDEAKAINMSLLHLGEVINSLSTGKRPNYRNSLLTQLLADSLGGSAKTLMFVCVGPSAYNTDTSFKSLQYAERAKKIQNDVSKKAESQKLSGLKKAVGSLGDALRYAVENGGQLPAGMSLTSVLDEAQDFSQVG